MSGNRGGKRPGAGRPKGAVQRVSAEARALAAKTGKLPHEILLAIAQGDDTILGIQPTPEQRIDCARAAAPYYAPRLAVAEVKHSGENPMAELMARISKGPSGLPYKR